MYNDYELIYEILEHDEFAYNVMVDKYKRYIYSKIKSFKLSEFDVDDYYQEGLIVLNKAIYSFSETYNKTFMKYFERLLINRFINLKNNHINSISFDETLYLEQNYSLEEEQIYLDVGYLKKELNDLERNIFNEYFIGNSSISLISKKYNIEKDKLYVEIRKIRRKIKKTMI